MPFPNHFPARGRKQLPFSWNNLPLVQLSQPFPRKGTETFLPFILVLQSFVFFPNHFPARGRKLKYTVLSTVILFNLSQPFPRKGTETFDIVHVRYSLRLLSQPFPRKGTETRQLLMHEHEGWPFPTISPQGDGNFKKIIQWLVSL